MRQSVTETHAPFPVGRVVAWLTLAALLAGATVTAVQAGMYFKQLTTAIEENTAKNAENTAKSDAAMRAIMTHHPEFLPDGVLGGRLQTEKQ